MPSAPKVQRWVDIIAALLARRSHATFEELARDVPAYLADGSVNAGQPSPTLKRMFERDKKELRALGVPIATDGKDGDPETRYFLRPTDFYLPYLSVVTPRGATSKPRTTDQYGYRSLAKLTFEPDELVAVEEASRRARELGDPVLAADAESAMRKLAFDLPIDPERAPIEHLVPPRTKADPSTLQAIGDALVHRKRITFAYHSMHSRGTSTRDVEPYGLFFLNGHWYLAARPVDGDVVKNFRVSRIRDVSVNTKAATPDYDIPDTFHLREHGRSRQAWELGDGDATDAVVEFRGQSGAAVAGAQLGVAIDGAPERRSFRIRRMDAFARWLLSFAGEAVPVSPPELVEQVAEQVRATRALYERDLSVAGDAR